MANENTIVLDTLDPCAICLGDYNKSTRKAIQCMYCNVGICRDCVQKHLLSDGAKEANCPGCRAAWNQDFLIANLTAAFRTKSLKQHREKVLVDHERARLPEAQEEAERYKYAKDAIKPIEENVTKLEADYESNAVNKEINDSITQFRLNEHDFHSKYMTWSRRPDISAATEARNKAILENTRILRLQRSNPDNLPIPKPVDVPPLPAYSTELKACIARRNLLSTQIRDLRKRLGPFEKEIHNAKALMTPYKYTIQHYGLVRNTDGGARTKSERKFIHKCPSADCAGFLNASWECGLCDTKACKDCREPVVDMDSHVCNPDTVETVKAIAKEAKPCPKCGTLISKISGCDQMWCTQCKTAFSWNTGNIETTVIHNPHYFQWMRESGQVVPRRDVPGDGCNIEYRLYQVFRGRVSSTKKPMYRLSQIELYRRHHSHNLVRQLQRRMRDYEDEEWRRQLRVQRLVNEIMEDDWKVKLQRKEKAYYKERAQMQLIDMYVNVCRDIVAQLLDDASEESSRRILDQWKELKKFMDDERLKINKSYGCTSPDIFYQSFFKDWESW
jgi:hypothetical protein